MSRIEVVMPQMGESIAEGTIVKWHKKIGDMVQKDETLLEISTDKVDSEIPSPATGRLVEIVVPENSTVAVQSIIAYLEVDGPGVVAVEQEVHEVETPGPQPASQAPHDTAQSVAVTSNRFYSPLVLNIARTEGISMDELELIEGTGDRGRVTKKDVLAYAARRKMAGGTKEAAGPSPLSGPATGGAKPVDAPELRTKYPPPGHEILQMSTVQQKMAQHMVYSVQTSPHVSAIHEVDVSVVVKHREEHAKSFEVKEGFRLTLTPYIVDAVVRAIKKYPLVNSSLEGDKIIRKTYINLGLAVATDSGLLVPVIKHAEEKSFLGLARAVNDLSQRTRSRKLTPEDVQGGTFTISNYGVFGTLIGTPIINQPQVAILGTGAVRKRAVVIDDAIAIRSMAFFTLAFDHRIIDGALGGTFLEEIVQNIQRFDSTMKF
jgi:pyruvate/2-oxoglutarate dehydrogenase complex dihydrolipoamide acyltransferase (E2) component